MICLQGSAKIGMGPRRRPWNPLDRKAGATYPPSRGPGPGTGYMGSLSELLHCRCSGAANQPELKFPIRPSSQAGAKGLFVCAPCPVGKSPIWVKFVIAKKGSGLLVAGAMRSTASNAPLRAMRHTLHREVPIAMYCERCSAARRPTTHWHCRLGRVVRSRFHSSLTP
eukprot:COSAG03_NODE_1047_length_4952_cov_72.600453_3_plen_168_part_00